MLLYYFGFAAGATVVSAPEPAGELHGTYTFEHTQTLGRSVWEKYIITTFLYFMIYVYIRDGVIAIKMYSNTSTIILNLHEYEYKYEYSENTCTRVRVRLLYNVLEYEYDYIRI